MAPQRCIAYHSYRIPVSALFRLESGSLYSNIWLYTAGYCSLNAFSAFSEAPVIDSQIGMGNAKGYILAIALPSHIHTSLYLCHEESEDFSKPKIIWGEISDKSKFAFDFLGEYIPEATSFYMKGECIEYLLSALNSSVSEWLFSKVGTTTGVGTIRWKKYTIEQLIVAKLSTEQLNTHLAAFNDLKVGKMSITDFECFSNKLMYDVYKLTSDEIQYIENQQIV